jgi:acetyl/propionyl-CoA carboxylase alpha subunit
VSRDGVSTSSATWVVHPIASDAEVLRVEVDDRVHEASVRIGPHRVDVAHLGHTFTFARPDPFGPDASVASSDGTVVAPMPGTVLAVSTEVGRTVEVGDVLGVMEAMKMELSLKAPVAGTVITVGAAAGDQVALGATLFVVEPTVAEERA